VTTAQSTIKVEMSGISFEVQTHNLLSNYFCYSTPAK